MSSFDIPYKKGTSLYSKWGSSNWGETIKADILECKMRITTLEARIDMIASQTNPLANSIGGDGAQGNIYLDGVNAEFDRLERFMAQYREANNGFDFDALNRDLVMLTGVIRTATTALKGYVMLLQQFQIGKDNNEAIQNLNNVAMTAMKTAATVMLAMEMIKMAMASNPAGAVFYAISMGGTLAASLSYGNKVSGGF